MREAVLHRADVGKAASGICSGSAVVLAGAVSSLAVLTRPAHPESGTARRIRIRIVMVFIFNYVACLSFVCGNIISLTEA